jgi:soluble lytic murein transglycosylase
LVAVAATMEDYLPAQITADEIAPLYEKAAHCFPKNSVDRENFLTRAGLLYVYKNDYAKAEKMFSKTNAVDAFSGRTLYWLYRSRRELGKTTEAEIALKHLLERHRFSFHAILAGLLAGKDAAADYFANGTTPIAEKRSPKNKKLNQYLEAIENLHQFHFDESGTILAGWTSDWFTHIEPNVRIYLAEMGDPALQVTSVPAMLLRRPSLIQRETMELAYPKAFSTSFDKQASTADPLLLLALARKESLFDPKAISPTNAQGLLQIQPETAKKLIADNATASGPPDLLNPETNITLGARYLSQLIERQSGNLLLALASYNAGEDAVRNWGKRYPTSDLILFIDLIPYRETRDYVTIVLANYYWYSRGYGAPGADPIKKIAAELAKK